jgi:hypothetical protein
MNPADEMATNIEPAGRRSAGPVADSSDMLHRFDERFRAVKDLQLISAQRKPMEDLRCSDDKSNKQLEELNEQLDNLLRPGPQQEPAKDLHNLALGIDRHGDHGTSDPTAIYSRPLAIENEMKRRRSQSSRGLIRYVVAICIGVAATLAWQSYGEATKQIIATGAPEFGWSPEAKQMIASWVLQLSWTRPVESSAVRPSAPEMQQAALATQAAPQDLAPKAPTPSVDPDQVHQLALDLVALRQTVERLAAGQERILEKISVPPLPRPAAVLARKPIPSAPLSSRASLSAQLPPYP